MRLFQEIIDSFATVEPAEPCVCYEEKRAPVECTAENIGKVDCYIPQECFINMPANQEWVKGFSQFVKPEIDLGECEQDPYEPMIETGWNIFATEPTR